MKEITKTAFKNLMLAQKEFFNSMEGYMEITDKYIKHMKENFPHIHNKVLKDIGEK